MLVVMPNATRFALLDSTSPETFGPVFGRYLGSQLWQGETYYMQVDAHTTFARGWDDILREDYALAPSKKAVFSHYPLQGPKNRSYRKRTGTPGSYLSARACATPSSRSTASSA